MWPHRLKYHGSQSAYSEEYIAQLKRRKKWGELELSAAIRPTHLEHTPRFRRGYRQESYRVPDTNKTVPVLLITETRSKIFSLFLAFWIAFNYTPRVWLR